MGNAYQIRTDLLFQFDNTQLGESYLSYNLNDFLVRVEKISPESENEVRYGVMLDFEKDDTIFKKSYLLEIPVSATTSESRKAAQEEIIKQYIAEMRDKFQSFYAQETTAGTVDEFDKMERTLNSADGKWNIIRKFRKQHLTRFLDWLLIKSISSKTDAEKYLVQNRMAFETHQEYLISVDWAVPYICFKEDHKVSHFNGGYGNANLYHPFHNFAWQSEEYCTKISVEADKDYARQYERGIAIKPSNYSLFAFYSHVIDEICYLQQENYQAIKPYYVYIQNLNSIRSLLTQFGPVAKLSENELEALNLERTEDWDGDTSDDWWGDHNADFARGLTDISEAIELFNGVVLQESKTGRNANRSVQIEALAYNLKNALLDNQYATSNYSDLWAFNLDGFGIDLFIEKTLTILSQMPYAEEIYNDFLKESLYEHKILDETIEKGDRPDIDIMEWGNILYRSDNLTFNLWMSFYPIREKIVNLHKGHHFTYKVAHQTPHPGKIDQWIIDNAIAPQSLLGTEARVGTNTAPQDYTEWKLSDEQIRKLTNYLLGGGQIEELKSIEADLSSKIKQLLGTVSFKDVPFDRIEELHRHLLELKESLVEKLPAPDLGRIQHGLNFSAAGINLLLARITYDNAYAPGASLEAKLRAHTLAIGVFSDVANTIAKFKGIEATLIRTAAKKAGARTAISLGAIEFLGGGVGGVLGAIWFVIDGFRAFDDGLLEHSALDLISAAGCIIGAAGLAAHGSIIGIPAGIACNIIGFSLVLIAQLLKYTRVFISAPEEVSRKIISSALEDGGVDKFKHFHNEMDSINLELPTSLPRFDYAEELIERITNFIMDWDTFDSVEMR